MSLRGILLLVYFLGSLPVCFIRPYYGIVLWAVVAFLNPQSYVWSTPFNFPWAVAVAIPTLAGFFVFCPGWPRRLMCREFFLLLILWTWFTITTLISVQTPLFVHHQADTWYRWNFVSKVLLMTVVTMGGVDTFARLRKLIIVICSCLAFFVVKALPFMVLTGASFRLYGPDRSMIADNNDFGLALNMTAPLLMLLAQTETKPWVKGLYTFLFIATIPAIFFTYSRGALFGLIVVSLFMFLQLRQRWILLPVAAFAVLVAVMFAPPAWQERMNPFRHDAVDASARQRLNAWAFAWNLFKDCPVTGGGFETFTPELYQRYAPNLVTAFGPHSIYFGVLAEHGFIGFALYLTLLLSCFLTSWRVSALARLYGDELAMQYAIMFRLSLLGFLASGLFLGRAYFDYFFTMVACTAILKRVCLLEWFESPDPSAAEDAAMDVHGVRTTECLQQPSY